MDWFPLLFLAVFGVGLIAAVDYSTDPSVQLLQQYLRFNTTSRGNLTPAVDFWKQLVAAETNYTINVYEFTAGYPVVVIKAPGTNSSLGSIMLNSHMDVVPASASDGWTYPPFNATLDANGVIWARGVQDCKSIAIQYWLALKKIRAKGTHLRDVYITLMPDEEIGGDNGMVPFVNSTNFTAMNVGFGMDEGGPYPINGSLLFYRDKAVWRPDLDVINGGVANNVIPGHVSMIWDIRLNGSLSVAKFETQLKKWINESGTNITMTYILKGAQTPATICNDTNPWWTATIAAANRVNISMIPTMPPGATDSRFVRAAGIPAFGFSPQPNTPLLVHSVNERLSAATFLNGITVYESLIKEWANLAANKTSSNPSDYIIRYN